MNHYYSDSLLSAYLESTDTLQLASEKQPSLDVPVWKVDAPRTPNAPPTCDLDTSLPSTCDPNTPVLTYLRISLMGTSSSPVPSEHSRNVISPSTLNSPDALKPHTFETQTRLPDMHRASVHSGASCLSASSLGSASLVLSHGSIALQGAAPARNKSHIRRLRDLFGTDHTDANIARSSADSAADACANIEHYFIEPGTVPWTEVAETFFFGNTLDALFPNQDAAVYLCHSEHELGSLSFINHEVFHALQAPDPVTLLRAVAPCVAAFDEVLDVHVHESTNRLLPQLFEKFQAHATHAAGLCLPLAMAMFGNWLLDYSRDGEGDSNYENEEIFRYFRKAARFALAIRRLVPWFEPALEHIATEDRAAMSRFLHRDLNNALALALSSLALYYQYSHNHTVAVSLWELNCHLTEDSESGHLAILGLTNGFGIGNRIKERRFGMRTRAHKFATKRRIAHLYRILMQQPDFNEYGASWATKEKYD